MWNIFWCELLSDCLLFCVKMNSRILSERIQVAAAWCDWWRCSRTVSSTSVFSTSSSRASSPSSSVPTSSKKSSGSYMGSRRGYGSGERTARCSSASSCSSRNRWRCHRSTWCGSGRGCSGGTRGDPGGGRPKDETATLCGRLGIHGEGVWWIEYLDCYQIFFVVKSMFFFQDQRKEIHDTRQIHITKTT